MVIAMRDLTVFVFFFLRKVWVSFLTYLVNFSFFFFFREKSKITSAYIFKIKIVQIKDDF